MVIGVAVEVGAAVDVGVGGCSAAQPHSSMRVGKHKRQNFVHMSIMPLGLLGLLGSGSHVNVIQLRKLTNL